MLLVQELREAYGIVFSRLFALNNMPIKRYVDYLRQRGELERYMQLLVDNFNPHAAEVRNRCSWHSLRQQVAPS